MPSTFLGLNTAYTGLQAYQAAINTTAHNISNTKTEGYSRQKTDAQADRALRTYNSYGTLGTGVLVTSIKQLRDEYYDIRYRTNNSNAGQYSVYENYMTQLENYLNEYSLEGMTTEWNNLFAALTELQKYPQDNTTRNNVVNCGASLADYFNNLSTNIRKIQIDANEELKNQCDRVNTLAQNITELNKQINMLEVHNGNANDLRDQRNKLVDELSAIINVETNEQEMGEGVTYFTVRVNGQDLVNNYNYNTLVTEAKKERRNASDAEGMYEIAWANGVTFDEYSTSLRGSMKALLDIRDGCNNAYEVENTVTDANGTHKELDIEQRRSANTEYKGVPYYQSKLNEFVNLMANAFNDVFKQGETTDGVPGVDFFTIKYTDAAMSAMSVELNPILVEDNTRLATTTNWLDGEAKSDLVDELLALQSKKIFNGGTGSYFLESIVGAVAIDSEKATTFYRNFRNISHSVDNQRLSVMGVDDDEEAMDLLKYQQAYNLCAKMMSVLNEVYNKLINETGL
ncbi:MAG: flagellar hook-associated protein FlgK [Alistipes sp.]|nr:flagellar hook-associated protein FlgK [Alistipes sp.]